MERELIDTLRHLLYAASEAKAAGDINELRFLRRSISRVCGRLAHIQR